MSKKDVKVVVTEVDGVLSAVATEATFLEGMVGGVTSIFSTSEAFLGTAAMIGKGVLVAGAVYGTAYLKDGEFNLNPFA